MVCERKDLLLQQVSRNASIINQCKSSYSTRDKAARGTGGPYANGLSTRAPILSLTSPAQFWVPPLSCRIKVNANYGPPLPAPGGPPLSPCTPFPTCRSSICHTQLQAQQCLAKFGRRDTYGCSTYPWPVRAKLE